MSHILRQSICLPFFLGCMRTVLSLCTNSKASLESIEVYLNWKFAWRSSERSINSPCIILCCSFSSTLGITLAMVTISVAMQGALEAVCEPYGRGPMVVRVANPALL